MAKLSRQLLNLVFFISTCLIVLPLPGCIDLAVNDGKNKQALRNKPTDRRAEVYTMRGGLGGVFSKGMNHLEDTLQNDYQIPSSSTVWYKANALSKEIINEYKTQHQHVPIILVGHSLGANEQIKVAKNLANANIPVALLITVDAVAPIRVPPNVRQAINIYKPSFVPMFSGLKLKAVDPKTTRIENLNVATFKDAHVNHFTIDKDEKVQQIMIQNILATLTQKKIKKVLRVA
jgi:hypothetical protein